MYHQFHDHLQRCEHIIEGLSGKMPHLFANAVGVRSTKVESTRHILPELESGASHVRDT